MPFTFDFVGSDVRVWSKTEDGAMAELDHDYTPSLFVSASEEKLDELRLVLGPDPKVVATEFEAWYTSLRRDAKDPVLRIDVEAIDDVRQVAKEIRLLHEDGSYTPGTFRLYNVDFSQQFCYCIETETTPVPEHPLTTFELDLSEKALADGDLSEIAIDGETVRSTEETVLRVIQGRLEDADPDILVLSSGELVPLLAEKAAEYDLDDFALGRLPGWTRLSRTSSYESYGRVGHSPARYHVPGRVLIDKSSSFFWKQTSLQGILNLVGRSWKPLQEAGWASMGNVLTAIQTRMALERGVLIPWNKWEPEAFKNFRELHAADRGGFTFEPEVGLHEEVCEIDFASLYPNIICRQNISPETILCDCHADREDVPGLGYNICDEPGFLPDVLQPILDDRATLKRQIEIVDDEEEQAELRSQSGALKWILVTCFGYQGYRNSKFGRIECHEAINAYAREILLDSKNILERNGWEVIHGIVDSLWVRRMGADPTPIEEVTSEISEEIQIKLEFEAEYDWVCFVPKRNSNAGALTKYFGKVAGEDEFKVRGIELRQHSTPEFIKDAQRDLLETLDETRSPEAVCDRLQAYLTKLQSSSVPTDDLVITQCVSKHVEDYQQQTRAVAALKRAEMQGVERHPGQQVRYVVIDDDARPRNRVRLDFEECETYDAEFYGDLLIRACESLLSPLGWDRTRIRKYIRPGRDLRLSSFE